MSQNLPFPAELLEGAALTGSYPFRVHFAEGQPHIQALCIDGELRLLPPPEGMDCRPVQVIPRSEGLKPFVLPGQYVRHLQKYLNSEQPAFSLNLADRDVEQSLLEDVWAADFAHKAHNSIRGAHYAAQDEAHNRRKYQA